ncbi:TrkH-domain-containing protein [Karstenula rhodostoma CBS 690.94]|uniref:TrkH-domain-containing protein n=1 Tax=Karstenula rhodostoma CBS 690.94 TaxID=1392251 RepID=A0A9P4UIN2_9PLEO|nr:TrkH-domain-containing protein [Karstenula rhodostoma CBS 690.94]
MLFSRVPSAGPFRRARRAVHGWMPSLNFITLHYIYFIGTCLVSSAIFYAASTPPRSVSYTDSLFLVTSAMTEAGLNTVNLSSLNTFQQLMLFFLIMIGSAIFVSAFVVQVRMRAFEHRFEYVAEQRRRRAERARRGSRSLARRISRSLSRSGAREDEDDHRFPAEDHPKSMVEDADEGMHADHSGAPTHISFGPDTYHRAQEPSSTHRHLNRFMGVGADSHATIRRRPQTSASTVTGDFQSDAATVLSNNNLPFASSGILSRNSHFHHLTEEEREQLGGYEYRAVILLSWLVPTYYMLFQLFGCIGLGAYVATNKSMVTRANGLNPWWVGAFNAVSAFNNSGMSLLDANMVAFQKSAYILITMGLLILAGNTAYPIFLRLIVWTSLKLVPNYPRFDDFRKTLQFLLDHPRRCYTNMFPSRHTWWLLACLICLNGVDWAAFEILNIGNTDITGDLSTGYEVLDGLFQALAVRSGGFYVVTIALLPIALQVLYVVMMYISVYPVVITMRNSNVYEERSLGIYTDDPGYAASQTSSAGILGKLRRKVTGEAFEHTKSYFVRQQLRAQLAHDLWSVVLAVFLIMIIEGSNFKAYPAEFSVFNVVFETVSAYGCVGISVGFPGTDFSFSGSLHILSKLVLCAVMVRGRHRGLPVAIDKAVLLPGEGVDEAEEEDGEIRMERVTSRGRIV